MFVSGINAFCEIWASTPYQKLEVPESQLYINASCQSLCCSCGKKICLMQGSRGFGHGDVVSKNCNGMLILLLCVAASLSAACVWKMWLTPEKRFMRHVCLRNPFLPLLLGIPSIHSLPEAGSWERQCALHYGCIMPIPLLQWQEKDVSYAEKQRVWSRSFFLQDLLQYSDCVLSRAMWLLQTNEQLLRLSFLATVGWKCGCEPFSCLCLKNVTHSRKEICATCLFKESIPAITFGNSKHPLPARSRFLRVAVRSSRSALCLRHAHAFVAAEGKNLSHAEKQRNWSQSYGLQDLSQYSDCALSRAIWLLQTNEQLLRLSFLATVGWKCGCQPFSCLCLKNVTHSRKEIYATCLFEKSIPAITFGNSKHPLPAKSRFLRAAVCSELWLHHAHPFVAVAGCVLCREAEGLVAEFFSPRFVTVQWLCCQLCYVTAANQWTMLRLSF